MWDYREKSIRIEIICEDTIKWIGFELTLRKKKKNVLRKRWRHEQTFLQRRHTNGQQTHEKNVLHRWSSGKYKSKLQDIFV